MEENKNNNTRSLFLYTGLIFVVAIILIIIAFFGQSKLDNSQPVHVENQDTTSITERAAILSEENKTLLEENRALKSENATLKSQIQQKGQENTALTSAAAEYQKGQENVNLLFSANAYYLNKSYKNAKSALAGVNIDALNADQQALYNYLTKKLK